MNHAHSLLPLYEHSVFFFEKHFLHYQILTHPSSVKSKENICAIELLFYLIRLEQIYHFQT